MTDTQTENRFALYIHWPFCKAKCPYCDFNSHVREQVDQAAWRDALLTEMRYMQAQMPDRQLWSIFFGGGTPSLMPPETVAALIEEAHRLWPSDGEIEITLEANPTSSEAAKFAALAQAGVNRLSIGIQSLREEELRFLGREHSVAEALEVLALAAKHVPRYSFDLIYARPGQSVAAWEQELREALAYSGGHLSLYQLTIEEGTAFHHAYHVKHAFALPDEDTAAALYECTEAVLAEAGMQAYEVSNYALPGQESRHNLCDGRGLPDAGIGPGAHGRLLNAQGWQATQAIKSPERWLSQIQAAGHGMAEMTALSPEERMQEQLLMGLRLHEGIDGVLPVVDAQKLAFYEQQGLVRRDGSRLIATPSGRMVLNQLLGELMA
jgi:oxygen-independent coproporphyrinogen-3 oxidase